MLESIGGRVGGFLPFQPNRLLEDGDEIDVWHGLRAVHLPGHTRGHMGFYCEPLRLLFSADLFASYGLAAHLPPAIFNHDSAAVRVSLAKACQLDLAGVLPNHGDSASPEIHLERMRAIASKTGIEFS